MPRSLSVTRKRPIRGDCMAPLLEDGDELWVRSGSWEELREGEIAVFARWEESRPSIVAHRLLRLPSGPAGALTRADSRRKADAPLETRDLMGRVVGFRRRGKTVAFGTSRARLYDKLCLFYARVFHCLWREWVLYPLMRSGRDRAARIARAAGLAPARIAFRLLFP